MSTITKRILAVALTGALLVPAVSTAQAEPGDLQHDRRGMHNQPWQHPHRNFNQDFGHRHKHRKNNDVGAAVAAGIIGLAAGAILLGATNQPRYVEPPRDYYPPQPYPGRVSGSRHGYGLQPWSPAWYDYCHAKYRSFNPATGTYTTYRGEQRFCQ